MAQQPTTRQWGWTVFSSIVSIAIIFAFIFLGKNMLQIIAIKAFSAITILSTIIGIIAMFVRMPMLPPPSARQKRILLSFFLISIVVGSLILNIMLWVSAHCCEPIPSHKANLLAETTIWPIGLSGWVGSSQWSQSGGLLTSDGSKVCCGLNDLAIWAPYIDLPNDYTVVAEIREKGVNDQQPRAPGVQGRLAYFGILVRGSPLTNNGYSVQVEGPTTGFVKVVLNVPSAQPPDILLMSVKNKVFKDDWHTYWIEVKGSSFTVKVDNDFLFTINDDTFAKGQTVGLWDSGAQLEVRSFKVYGL